MLWTRRSNNVDVFAVNRIDNEQQCPDLSCSLPQSSVPLPSPESYFPQLPSLTNHPPLYLTSWFHSLLVRASVLFRLAAHVAAVANTSWFCFPSLFLVLVGFISFWVLFFQFSFSWCSSSVALSV